MSSIGTRDKLGLLDFQAMAQSLFNKNAIKFKPNINNGLKFE